MSMWGIFWKCYKTQLNLSGMKITQLEFLAKALNQIGRESIQYDLVNLATQNTTRTGLRKKLRQCSSSLFFLCLLSSYSLFFFVSTEIMIYLNHLRQFIFTF